MTTVTIGVSCSGGGDSANAACVPSENQGALISFASPELLWKVITPKRLELLRALTGAGPISIREIARRVGRDVKSVHGDIQALIAGILDRAEDGHIRFSTTKSTSISCCAPPEAGNANDCLQHRFQCDEAGSPRVRRTSADLLVSCRCFLFAYPPNNSLRPLFGPEPRSLNFLPRHASPCRGICKG